MVQAALLKVERNSKNQIRHHHDYWERAELIRAEPEWCKGLTGRYRTRFSANQHRRSGKVRDILVLLPTVPQVCCNQCDSLSDTRTSAPRLVLPVDQIAAMMENVGDP